MLQIAEKIRPTVDKYHQAFPAVLEIPSKDHPYGKFPSVTMVPAQDDDHVQTLPKIQY
jgi:vacuolar-type H+-ATPase subunit F/Vma7